VCFKLFTSVSYLSSLAAKTNESEKGYNFFHFLENCNRSEQILLYKDGMLKFEAFYSKQKNKLFAYLMRLSGDYDLSADIMQESFVRYLENYGSGDGNMPLLYRIARNAFLDHIRRKRDNYSLNENEGDNAVDQEHLLMVREEYRMVLSALEKLEGNERDLLALAVTSELSYEEIGAITGLSKANVKVKVHRARLKLKKLLQEGEV